MVKKTNKSPEKLVDESEKTTNVIAFNENGSVGQMATADAKRIRHLKRAINKGNYAINPLRVAEKFIQFETQLSA